jgi:ATP-binding cassette, subfamily B, multidrug efflux pump
MTDKISFYFKTEWKVLFIVTISGIIYNIGLVASPWFEGQLAGCLMNILNGNETFNAMLYLSAIYILVIFEEDKQQYLFLYKK